MILAMPVQVGFPRLCDPRIGGTPWVIIIGKDGKVVFNDFHVDPQKAISTLKNLINTP
jgi:hypothetical protein